MSTEPTPSSSRADLIGRILGYMDRPWKAAVVVCLLILCGLGYAGWTERDRLAEALLAHPGELGLRSPAELADSMARVAHLDGVAYASLWSLSIRQNAARFITARQHDGSSWKPADLGLPDRLPAITDASQPTNLLTLLRGSILCDDPSKNSGLLFTALVEDGIRKLCLIPVPPTNGQVLAIIILAWRDLPNPRAEGAAVDAAAEISRSMVEQ